MQTLEITKSFVKVLKWLLASVSRHAGRPALQCIHYSKGILAAVNGFAMHCYRVEDESTLRQLEPEGKTSVLFRSLMLGTFGKRAAWVVENEEATYPNYTKVFPSPDNQVAMFAFNPKLLIQVLTSFPHGDDQRSLIFRLYGQKDASGRILTVENQDDTAVAVAMGIFVNTDVPATRDFSSWGWKQPEA